MTSVVTDPDELLEFLQNLVAQLVKYKRSPIPARRFERIQALCWDLEGLLAACPKASSKLGVAAAEDWLVCFQAYARALDEGQDALKAAGWLWARGSTDDHAETTGEALTALKDAGAELMRSTIALAQVVERMAREASEEALRVRPDLAQRFSVIHASCARATVALSTRGDLAGLGTGVRGGAC